MGSPSHEEVAEDTLEARSQRYAGSEVEQEEDPLSSAKKAVKQEKTELSDQVHEASDELEDKESKLKKSGSHENKLSDVHSAKETSKPTHSATDTTIATNAMNSTLPAAAGSQKAHKTHLKSDATEVYQELEAIAEEILAEAEVLKNGDEVVTTVSLNMEGSIFDKGEVTVKAYRYRPLEVNLSFKKFGHQGTHLMQKNSDRLKKVLKEKSLKVHQLDIIE